MCLHSTFRSESVISLCAAVMACLLWGLFSSQQPIPEKKTTAEWIEEGNTQWVAGYYDSAYVAYRTAQALASAGNQEELFATAQHLSGKYLARNGRLEEAEATLDSVIAMRDRVGPLFPSIVLARCERSFLEAFRGEFQLAIEMFEAVVRDTKPLPPSEDSLRAKVYHRMGNIYAINEQYPQALEYCAKALEIRKRILPPDAVVIAHSENSLGAIKSWMDQYEAALGHYERAMDILSRKLRPGHTSIIQIKTNMAVLFEDLGLYWEALEMHRANLPFLDSLSPEAQYSALFNYAATLSSVGDYAGAIQYFDETEARLNEYPENQHETRFLLFAERSRLYQSKGEFERAYVNILTAIKETKASLGPRSPRLIGDYIQKGTILSKLGRGAESNQAFDEALRIVDMHPETYAVSRGFIPEFKGEALLHQGKAALGLEQFRKAQTVYSEKAPWHLADIYGDMAMAWRALGNWDSTVAMHQLAWESLAPTLPFQLSPGPEIYNYWDNTHLQVLLEEQGNSLREQYRLTDDQKWLKAGLAAYEASLAVADSQRQYYESGDSKQLSRQYQLPIYEVAIEMAVELYQLNEETAYLIQAFSLAEKSKAGNLLDHLRSMQALEFAGVPDSLVERERYYRQRLAAMDATRLSETRDSVADLGLPHEQVALHEAYQAFLKKIAQKHPAYYQLKYPRLMDSQLLPDNLGDSQAMYSYFWGKEQVFVFHVFQGKWAVHQLDRDSNLEQALNDWLAFVSRPPDERSASSAAFGEIGSSLGAALLPGLSAEMTQLLIIPDGELGYLPFESLLVEPTQGNAFRDWPYLVRTHGMLYAYSAELWVQQRSLPHTNPASYQGFAPDFIGEELSPIRAGLGPLAYNREEVSQVAKLLRGEAWIGNSAREASVKQLGEKPVILHFATHALADEADLMQSRLYFAQDTSDAEDGILHAYEIYGLSINSPLTVLSACQTGKGQLLQGEGIMSLARAFQFSGSKRVLSTLWQADDRAGATLVQSFFQLLSAGTEITHALQQSRLQWLEQSDTYHCHPYYWAGYVLIGEGGTISVASQAWYASPVVWILTAIMLLAILGIVTRRYTK